MTPATEYAWAFAHAYDRSQPKEHNKNGDCPFCKEERARR